MRQALTKNETFQITSKITKEELIKELLKLMADDNKWVEMRMHFYKLAKPNADELIVDEVLKLVK